MRRLIIVWLLAVAGLSLPLGASSARPPKANAYPRSGVATASKETTAPCQKTSARRAKLDGLLAPIHSRHGLEAYLKTTPPAENPLDRLSPEARKRFLAGLVFGRGGLGGFSFADLRGLTATEIYRILSLFGMQHYTSSIRGARVVDEADALLMCRPHSPRSTAHHEEDIQPESRSIEQRFNLLYNASLNRKAAYKNTAAIISKKYDKLLAFEQNKDALGTVTNSNLKLLFRAADMVAFYKPTHAKYRQNMALDLAELAKRGLVSETSDTNYYYLDMYDAFIRARKFARARTFRTEHSTLKLPTLPKYREAPDIKPGGPTKLVVNPEKQELVRRRVDLHKPAQIVVIFSPFCHFASNGFHAIQANPTLRKLFSAHALWLAPPEGELNFAVIQRWNRQHPHATISLAFHQNEWPMFDSWELPTFYFFKNGSLMTMITGWPGQGHLDKIQGALREIGLLQ